MGKKKAAPSKPQKLGRSSTMNQTIAEGKDFVDESNKVRRVREARKVEERARAASQAAAVRRIKPAKKAKPVKKAVKKAKTPKKVRTAPKAARVSAVAPAARSASRMSQGVNRTSSKNSVVIEQELHDRLNRHGATIGELNFSLRWWDPNDLDLHVICPCGT